jgi:hypothetical protein
MIGAYFLHRVHDEFKQNLRLGTEAVIKLCIAAFPSIWVIVRPESPELSLAERKFLPSFPSVYLCLFPLPLFNVFATFSLTDNCGGPTCPSTLSSL